MRSWLKNTIAICTLGTLVGISGLKNPEQEFLSSRAKHAREEYYGDWLTGKMDRYYVLSPDSVVHYKMQCGRFGCLSKYFLYTGEDAQKKIDCVMSRIDSADNYGRKYIKK